ncbi:3,4-dihydroxy-2-butanone-4-phosphate synthase [Actinomycetospora termitidis]|uniref:3,4-dihydroxy-2-butanone-4-phosphate synthase n=1 Tax=Actinomycetospora termitidis TaxID=3053470 RepID=A0ABT7M7P3_9PSEU|nr:3,4-dihydroxy-2-butanone-4-phosphate synthase [Actinomycetospora sp. Odt1-22]MDL5156042.1 3,4-dihydroxy-2-butanone-4-phosphate synthase [Actinomycetospora sp. Odt1-22]
MSIDITTRRRTPSSVLSAIDAIAAGRAVVLVDEQHDSADLVFAAATAGTAVTAFTVRHSGGFLEVALDDADCRRLRLTAAAGGGSAQRVSVDLRRPGTGISAADRAATMAALADPERTHGDFTRPGHVVPLRAEPGGLLLSRGRAEAAADLVDMAGLPSGAGLAALVSPEQPWEMADHGAARTFAAEHDLAVVSIGELHAHRLAGRPLVVREATVGLPTALGPFEVVAYRAVDDSATHVVMRSGDLAGLFPVPVHVHHECLTGDMLGSTACACGTALTDAMTTVKEEGRGLVVYLRPSGTVRGCGLLDDPDDSDLAAITAAVLKDLDVARVRLLHGAATLAASLHAAGVEVVDAAPGALAG